MSVWNQVSLHNGCSSSMLYMEEVYDWVMVTVTMTVAMIMFLVLNVLTMTPCNLSYLSNELLEFTWVSIPSLILFVLAIPSLHCLYMLEETYGPVVTVKVIGHQWYWSYEYSDTIEVSFDSYLSPQSSSVNRLLEVDNSVCIPIGAETRVLISSSDVLHSWALPTLGMKVDAIPGRINQALVYPKKVGTYYGQCSEMCGAMHSFMPIRVMVLPSSKFILWLTAVNQFPV
uniref:Cytochrome c oxidase subunit 2 n=1 Tax=Hoplopleura sp. TaxID=2782173 RepID=A0A7S8WWA8_9NEOP|nr:cytochrome c oxidase subunit 2 [Hoplopleura sp.]